MEAVSWATNLSEVVGGVVVGVLSVVALLDIWSSVDGAHPLRPENKSVKTANPIDRECNCVRFGPSESNSNGTVATPAVRWFLSVLRIMVAVVTKLRELPRESPTGQ